MSLLTAPYNESMRIGSGFNSYTQQLRVNDAVIKENKTALTDKDLRGNSTGKGNTISQQVTFTSKFVEHASDITEALNISGALEIKYQGMGAKAAGSYLDSSKVKESDINYFVQVKVVNQQLIADDATKFNVIPNIPVTNQKRFTEVYGDSYISGFLEGGEFNALLSIKLNNKENATKVKGALSVELSKAGFGISGQAEGDFNKSEIAQNSETSITVSWAGGGDIRDAKTKLEGWTIDSMAKAAFAFPDHVRQIPQRTHAVITKYSALRSYQLLSNKGSPLDYENAGVYTNSLLESYLDYKDIWKAIGILSTDFGQKKTILEVPDTATETAKEIQAMKKEFVAISSKTQDKFSHIPETPYPGTLVGLEKARRDCRSQMIRIVKEVDDVADDPSRAIDFNRVGIYLSPLLFRQLLPIPEPRPTEKELEQYTGRIKTLEENVTGLTKRVNDIEEKRKQGAFAEDTWYSIKTAEEPHYSFIVYKDPHHGFQLRAQKTETPTYWKFDFKNAAPGYCRIISDALPNGILACRGGISYPGIVHFLEHPKEYYYWKVEKREDPSYYTFHTHSVFDRRCLQVQSGEVRCSSNIENALWSIEKKP
ncbi:hypothetical protein AFLA_003323 [Aspergillus flavus NRRL3357]|nr:uncharacterized protein G4B84_001586 [Aspergillus flavus NRRL3357]KAF7627955.1 hypothetical protein AFLA_003323 [Aspergillus flavus NRRL3357]QMW26341.1 hypothetical protein G4B84_001586 [Aspergillus flavus NRRL3357]